MFDFAHKVQLLLKSLAETEISGSDYKINQINNLYGQLEKEVDNFLPTPKQQYSMKAKTAYNNMISAKHEYEERRDSGVNDKEVKKSLDNYKESVKEYEIAKKIRDALSEVSLEDLISEAKDEAEDINKSRKNNLINEVMKDNKEIYI